jgi:hypothetical protein
MERAVADLPTYKADAADLKSELIKAGGSALVKLLLKLVNWVWELETLPTAWSQGVIVNLFKAGDTQLPGNYRGSPWYQSAARCLQTCCASAWVPSAPARGSGGVQKQKILHRQLVRAHAHPQEAGKANKTVYAFFLDVQSV